jgi:hypothetical protein
MPIYTSGALLSDARLTGHTGASTPDVSPNLPQLELNHYGVFGNLPTAEMSGTDTISNDVLIYTDPLTTTYLPALKLSARFGTNIQCIAGGMKLPTMSLVGLVGAVTGTGGKKKQKLNLAAYLPALSLEGTITFLRLMNLSANLSDLQLSANTGIRCSDDLRLPEARITASIADSVVGKLDLSMPGLSLAATGSSAVLLRLDQSLPPLVLTIEMTEHVTANFSSSLPALMISATGISEEYGILDATIPALLMASGTGYGSTMTLDAKISTLLSQMRGSGSSYGTGSGSIASNASRFTDYVLRHVR